MDRYLEPGRRKRAVFLSILFIKLDVLQTSNRLAIDPLEAPRQGEPFQRKAADAAEAIARRGVSSLPSIRNCSLLISVVMRGMV